MHALNTITQFVLKELPQILTIIICITTDIHGVKSHSHTQDVQRVLHGHREESHTEVLFSKSPFQQGNAALIHHKGRENSHFFVTFFFFSYTNHLTSLLLQNYPPQLQGHGCWSEGGKKIKHLDDKVFG